MTSGRTVAIMQPYFLPYLGYWQLMHEADLFVVYDDIQFTKRGWIHRNRFLRNGAPAYLTLPLKKGSDYADVRDRRLADDFATRAQEMLRKLEGAYRDAPRFDEGMALARTCLLHEEQNLFRFVRHSIDVVRDQLRLTTPLVVSSTLGLDRNLRAQDRVLAICEALGATAYLNAGGGRELYAPEAFHARGIELDFLDASLPPYPQFDAPFVPGLSIIDVVMFTGRGGAREQVLASATP